MARFGIAIVLMKGDGAEAGRKRKEEAMSDFSARLIYSPCLHYRVALEITGGRRFRAGEVEDDITERLRCLDCLEILSEAEVRASWGQESAEDLPILQPGGINEDDHGDSQ